LICGTSRPLRDQGLAAEAGAFDLTKPLAALTAAHDQAVHFALTVRFFDIARSTGVFDYWKKIGHHPD
jgi:hypothetical protein